MRSEFELLVSGAGADIVELRLFDEAGAEIAHHHIDWGASVEAGRRLALFSLRSYLSRYVEPGRESEAIADVGVCIAEDVLGERMFQLLSDSREERTLCVRLHDTADGLAARLLSLPWEIARISVDQPTLGESKLAIRIAGPQEIVSAGAGPLPGPGEPLRVLFIFAQGWGSRSLGARSERRDLRRLFETEIASKRNVVVDFLSINVSRERLAARLRRSGVHEGYHIVHWSGHGGPDGLRFIGPSGAEEDLPGEALLTIFREATGTLPRLLFLAACQSGEARSDETTDIGTASGGVGIAQALVAAGAASVIAMRYAVSDAFARDLAVEFYRHLLTTARSSTVTGALTRARLAIVGDASQPKYSACDYATPVLHGVDAVIPIQLKDGASPFGTHQRLRDAAELDTAAHEHFVGRFRELAALGAESLDVEKSFTGAPVALISGLGGTGKTALAAEALDLWEGSFRWVVVFQAKPFALRFETMLGDLHQALYAQPTSEYHKRLKAHSNDGLHHDSWRSTSDPGSHIRLVESLFRTLRSDQILLVLDNFETNLDPLPEDLGSGRRALLWRCRERAWEEFLSRASEELASSSSRVLITSRRPVAALTGRRCVTVRLGPLRTDDVDLYFRDHAGLAEMTASADSRENALANRLRKASHGHPLLLDRLARLTTPPFRPRLLQALEALDGYIDPPMLAVQSPDGRDDRYELDYLEDALAVFNDQLIGWLAPQDRLLLWIVALADEPVSRDLLDRIWKREGVERARKRVLAEILAAELDDEYAPDQPMEIQPRPVDLDSLEGLIALGLILETPRRSGDPDPGHFCHEVVRGRIIARMAAHPSEAGAWSEEAVLTAYAEQFEASFRALKQESLGAALEAGRRAIVLYARAHAYVRLATLAKEVVVVVRDPALMRGLAPYLEDAALSASGAEQWSCLLPLGVALTVAGRLDSSLRVFEQASELAERAAEVGGPHARQIWADLYAIQGNWAHALREVGDFDGARRRHLESADAAKRSGAPVVKILGAELEALRSVILMGEAAEALPEIEKRLDRVKNWHLSRQGGGHPEEAPDPAFLARVLIGALDLAKQAHFALRQWEPALVHIDALLALKMSLGMPDQDLAADRTNRSIALRNLRRFDEARMELERSLPTMKNNPASLARLLGSLALLFEAQGDLSSAIAQERRALAIREMLPNPRDRAISHYNLARYLRHGKEEPTRVESAQHQLSALIYQLLTGLKPDRDASLKAYEDAFKMIREEEWSIVLPPVAHILGQPSSQTLANWLAERQEAPDVVQTYVDEATRPLRNAALLANGAQRTSPS